jgi:hypothetical protein
MPLTLVSQLPVQYREELEKILFFNSRQHESIQGIKKSVEKYGGPRIYEKNGCLGLCTERVPDSQYLYALDETKNPAVLAGMLLFVRNSANTLEALHIAAAESYMASEQSLESSAAYQFTQTLIQIGGRLRGVERVGISCYRGRRRYFSVKGSNIV